MPKQKAEWVFAEHHKLHGRSGGNPAEYTMNPDIKTFVREVIQNSLDHKGADFKNTEVNFRFKKLSGIELTNFKKALGWARLRGHLDAVSGEKDKRTLREALDKSEKSLVILTVEDKNTIGLVGEETGDNSNFAALCRDVLFSNKLSETAGGSYGLGKAVLWLFSEFDTVIFSSVLERDEPGKKSPRLFGRTELPWHKINNSEYTGAGWFGFPEGDKGAFSVWGQDAFQIAEQLHLGRDGTQGTSILVVGFYNPADEDQTLAEMAEAVTTASAENYWPSIVQEKLVVNVEAEDPRHKGEPYSHNVNEDDARPALIECWKAYQEGSFAEELIDPGDIVERKIELSLPSERKEANFPVKGSVSLIVRLATEDEVASNQVAYFRGPGMIVKTKEFKQLSLTQRPFDAILVCGDAKKNPDDTDLHIEKFLRAAEPPTHDNWEPTKHLKERFRQGYKKCLDEMESRIADTLKALASEKAPKGTEGPELLMKLFPIGGVGKTPTPPSDFSVLKASARLGAKGWEFSGEIHIKPNQIQSKQVMKAEIDLCFEAEDSADAVGGVVKQLIVDSAVAEGVKATVADGVGVIVSPGDVNRILFTGTTSPEKYPIDVAFSTVKLKVNPKWVE